MKKAFFLIVSVSLILVYAGMAGAAEKKKMHKPAKEMTIEEQIKVARSAAPDFISKDAAIMVIDKDGMLMEAVKGTNDFTCMPDIEGQEIPDPVCYDKAAAQWINDFASGAPKPTNTMPGIAYMGAGGWHWEKDGKILPTTKGEKGAKRVKEPPHWMILWPFDSKATGLPTMPGKFGTYIMYEGTPWAHLMVYQNPNKMAK